MSRFYVPKEYVKDGRIFIKGEEAHHILNVMRLEKGDEITTFDGTGRVYSGRIKEAGRDSLVVEIVNMRMVPAQEKFKLTLMQAIPKKEKMDYIVEKATELGVSHIIPVLSERTIVKWDENKRRSQVERWRKITNEAAKQCGRSEIPSVSEIKDLVSAVRDMSECALKLMAALAGETVPLKSVLKDFKGGDVALAIGPEGDFTPDEVSIAKENGFKVVDLGPRVLKSDTAGLAALAIINYELT